MMFKKKKEEDAKPVEQEIAELQRKFRLLENGKRAASEDAQGIIRKQRATIEKLTRENKKMKAEMNETRSSSSKAGPEGKIAMETIAKLSEQRDVLLAKLDAESEQARTIESTLSNTQQDIFGLRLDMSKSGGVNAQLDSSKAVQKQIRILENRLDRALQKFNESITANRGLREQIDTLRRERVVFDNIYKKLESELQGKKKEMANIIEQANAAYEARDQAQSQMAALKQQADKEHVEFEREWKELGKLIQNDKKMKEFMKSKVKATKDGPDGEDDLSKSKRSATRAWDSTANELAIEPALRERVRGYEEAFAQIQAATGISDLDELVNNFVGAEDQNFALFKYSNELQVDIEAVEQQIADYREELTQLGGASSKKEDTEKTKALETLEQMWNDVDKKGIHYEVKYQEAQQTLAQVRSAVGSIFRHIGCSPQDLPTGCGNTVSEANMLQFLAAIEGRTNGLLKLYDAVRDGDDETDALRSRPGAAAALQVSKLPSTVEDHSDDEEDDEDDDQRPFSVEELQAKARLRTKRTAKGGKKR